MSRALFIAIVLTVFAGICADEPGWAMFNRRLGIFVHWGIYSVNGFHEQERMRKGMSRSEYEKCAAGFTAEKFDAEEFVRVAESAGAEYIVFTAKHHDGFCMWDTKTTDFKVTNTPAKRDVLKELAKACKRRGMRLGLYYSNPDWHHPNAYNPLSTHQAPPEPGDEPDLAKYREYVKAQLSELLTDYGEIVCLFWDIPTKVPAPDMNELVRKLQPGILVNNRGWGDDWDYSTPEREQLEKAEFTRFTEACDSVGAQSWGYRIGEDYHTVGYLTRAIDGTLAKGGNYLLNVGPRADGTIPERAKEVMRRVGAWYTRVRESFRDVNVNLEIVAKNDCLVTDNGQAFYVHFPKGLDACGFGIPPYAVAPERVVLLNTGKDLPWKVEYQPKNFWNQDAAHRECLHVLDVPADELSNECVVIKVERVSSGPERVAFYGDSITEGGRYLTHMQLISALRHPGEGIECHNVGKSGDTAKGGLARWEWDGKPVAADAARRAGIVSNYRQNMDALLDLIGTDCPNVTVMTPTPYDQYGSQKCRPFLCGNEPMLADFARIVRELAAKKGP